MSAEPTTHVVLIEMPASTAHDSMFIRRYKRVIAKFSGTTDDSLVFIRDGYKKTDADEILIPANFPNGEIPKGLDFALDGENYTVCRIDPIHGKVCDFEGEVICDVYKVRQSADLSSSLSERII